MHSSNHAPPPSPYFNNGKYDNKYLKKKSQFVSNEIIIIYN